MISMALVFVRLYRVIRIGFAEPEFRALFAAAMFVLLGGMIFYMYEEDWGAIDALYFCVTTLTTVGFGDPAPSTDLSKLFTVAYVIVGIGIITSFIAAVAERSRRIEEDRARKRTH
jgi:hypothetical protein